MTGEQLDLFAAVEVDGDDVTPVTVMPARQEHCATCGDTAHAWSGVTDWQDEHGAWIGWCSNRCRNVWLRTPSDRRK